MNRVLALIASATVLIMPACGVGVGDSELSGTVTLDGVPIPDGRITFQPDGTGAASAAPIADGRYHLRAQPGKKRVQVTASKMMPLPPGKTGMYGAKEEIQQYVPERYNSKTELTAEVSGPATLDFPLKSK